MMPAAIAVRTPGLLSPLTLLMCDATIDVSDSSHQRVHKLAGSLDFGELLSCWKIQACVYVF